MSRAKERPEMGLKLEVTVIPSKYLDWTLADIARQDLGDSATKQQGQNVRPPGKL